MRVFNGRGRHRRGRRTVGGYYPDLVARIAGGDREALTTLCGDFSMPVLRLADRELADPGQAGWVAMGVFVEVWWLAPRYRVGDGPVLDWVLGIAHRRIADRNRMGGPAPGAADPPWPPGSTVELLSAYDQRISHELAGYLSDMERRPAG